MRLKQGRRSISVFLCMAIILAGCAEQPMRPELVEPASVEYDTEVMERSNESDSLAYDAYMTPDLAKVTFPISGQIEEVRVIVGEKVEEGQILATLKQDSLEEAIQAEKLEIEYSQKEANIRKSIIEMEMQICRQSVAKMNQEMNELNQGHIIMGNHIEEEEKNEEGEKDEEKEALKEELKAAEEKLESIERQREEAASQEMEAIRELLQESIHDTNNRIQVLELERASQAELEKIDQAERVKYLEDLERAREDTLIRAPVSGVITGALDCEGKVLQNGAMIQGKEPVFYIAVEGDLYVVGAGLEEDDIQEFEKVVCKVGEKEYEVERASYTREEEKYAEANQEALHPRFVFRKPVPKLEAGNSVLLTVIKKSYQNVLTVSDRAIYYDGMNPYVIQISGDKQERVDVVLGEMINDRVEVLEGISEGKTVLLRGKTREEKANKRKKAKKIKRSAKVWYPNTVSVFWRGDSARINSLEISSGDRIEAGDTIASITPYANRSAVTRAEFLVTSLEAEYARSLRLQDKEIAHKQKEISKAKTEEGKKLGELEKAYAVLVKEQLDEEYEYKVKKAKKTLEQERTKEKNTTITSPISGKVKATVEREDGMTIAKGQFFCSIEDSSICYFLVSDREEFFYNMQVEISGTVNKHPVTIPGKVVSASNVLTQGAFRESEFNGKSVVVGLGDEINPDMQDIQVTYYREGY